MSFILPVLAILIIIATVASLGKEGLWGNAILLIEIVLASAIAVNFFEPLAALANSQLASLQYYSDFVCLWLLFTISFLAMRSATDYISRSRVRFHRLVDDFAGFALSVVIGWALMCFTVMTLHTAPLPRQTWGFVPEEKMIFGLAPDRVWLGFMQQLSYGAYARGNEFDPTAELMIKYASRRDEYAKGTPQ